MQTIPSHDDGLRIEYDTERSDILEFLDARLREPAKVGDAIVWNFHSRDLDAQALVEAELDPGRYLVPYQVSGTWAFMSDVLPADVSRATLLAYKVEKGEYQTFGNFVGDSVPADDLDSLQYAYYMGLKEVDG